MAVVGRADGDGVDVWPHLFQQLAKVVVFFRIGEGSAALASLLSSMSQMATTSPYFPASVESLAPLPPTPIQAKSHFLIGRLAFLGACAAGNPETDTGRGGSFQKIAPIAMTTHVRHSLKIKEDVVCAVRVGFALCASVARVGGRTQPRTLL